MLSRFLHTDDTHTWNAFRSGNHDAFAHIYQLYFDPLYAYGIKFTRDDALVADTLQQLFTELWHKRKSLGATNHIKNYLYKSFRRALVRRLKKSRQQEGDELDTNFAISLSYEDQLIQEQLDLEQFNTLAQAIHQLTEKQREVIYLRFYDGLSYTEISEITGASPSQVYDFMYKALKALRKNIGQEKKETWANKLVFSLLLIISTFLSCF